MVLPFNLHGLLEVVYYARMYYVLLELIRMVNLTATSFSTSARHDAHVIRLFLDEAEGRPRLQEAIQGSEVKENTL